MTPDPMASIDARLTALEQTRRAWLDDLDPAAAEVARVRGLPKHVVSEQLSEVLGRLDSTLLRYMLDEDLGDATVVDQGGSRPDEVLVLAAGTVPGLALEAAWWVLAMGSTAQVVPSRRDPSPQALAGILAAHAPDLADRLVLAAEPDWQAADAAIVFGADTTIDAVTRAMSPQAAVHGFGHRTSLAVVEAAPFDDDIARALAHDITRFGQQGCMSPTAVFMIGNEAAARAARTALERQIGQVAEHVENVDAAARHAADSLLLDALNHPAGASRALPAITHQAMTVSLSYGTAAEAVAWIDAWSPGQLSTVVVHADHATTEQIALRARNHGLPRVCAPGTAHHQPATWRHEGVGFVQPLIRAASA